MNGISWMVFLSCQSCSSWLLALGQPMGLRLACRQQQEQRDAQPALVRRVAGEQLPARAALPQLLDDEPGRHERPEIPLDRAMVLDDLAAEPGRLAAPGQVVVVDDPVLPLRAGR